MSDDNNNSDNDFPRNPPPSASPDDLRRHGNRLRRLRGIIAKVGKRRDRLGGSKPF